MEIATVSLRKVEASWNATRNTRNYSYPQYGTIRDGLARRLVAYATEQLTTAGFGAALTGCRAEVMTDDGDWPASDRSYQVTFTTPTGGTVSVDYILTGRGGWPVLDHGFSINRA